MKNPLFLNHMDYIYTVYREKSFSKAAEKLYISQPSLSISIKKIENEIGSPLFERYGKEITLTQVGEIYINAIEDIMRIQTRVASQVDDIMNLKRGKVSIGSTTYVASYLLPNILRDFQERYPDIEISIVVDHSSELEKKLESDEIDIIVDNVTTFLNWHKYTPLLTEHILLGVPKSLPINDECREFQIPYDKIKSGAFRIEDMPKISLSRFQNENFILLKRGNKIRQISSYIFDEAKMVPNVSLEFDRLHIAVSYAEAGFGLCFLTDLALLYKNNYENLNIYIPKTNCPDQTLFIINKKNKPLTHAASELVDFLAASQNQPYKVLETNTL